MTKVPKSWAVVPIIDVLQRNQNGKPFQQGWSPQCKNHSASEKKWAVLKTTAIQPAQFLDHENKELPEELQPRRHIEVQKGDLLMTCAGPRARCGVVCLVGRTRPKLMISGKMYRFRPNAQAMIPHFLSYFIQSRGAQVAIDAMKTGISDSGLNLTHDRFATLAVPVAPLPEQRRIVAKIEELLPELDKGVESLTVAREQLKAYRQSVLKYAFEGKLTTDWRDQNQDKLHTPESLIGSIRAHAEKRYEEALHTWEAAGKKGAKPTRPTSIDCVKISDSEILSPVPEGWTYIPFGAIAYSIRNGISKKPNEKGALRIFRISAVRPMKFDMEDFRHLDDDQEFCSYRLRRGDIVFTRYNGSPAYVGVAALYRSDDVFVYPDKLIRCEVRSPLIHPGYIEKAVNCGETRAFLESRIRTTAGQAGISGSDLKAMPVPICSIEEQMRIDEALEIQLSNIAHLEDEIEALLGQAELLRQSILKKAYSGRLVPQDSADEPASLLLERIRTEHGGGSTKRRRNIKYSKREAA